MSHEIVEIDTNFRPPVVKFGGRSPIRHSKYERNTNKSKSLTQDFGTSDFQPISERNWD